MKRKSKYPTVVGYWVYSLYVPSIDSYYIGMSKRQCRQRWQKSNYKGMALEQYLDEWQDMIKTVIQDGLTKEQAVQLEDELIVKYRNENRCINQQRSGNIYKNDKNAYAKEYYKTNEEYKEHQNNKAREYYNENREEVKRKGRERYHKNMLNEEFREKERKRAKERRAKKKLEKQQQQNQLTLFDLAS